MRTLKLLLAALVVALVAAGAGAAAPAGALPAGALPVGALPVTETLRVPTRHGEVRVDVVRPDSSARVPLLFTATPFGAERRADGGSAADDALAAEYVPRNVARAVMDVLGTGASEGCWDWGGVKEQESVADAVTFLSQQAWSNGRVAAVGEGYDASAVNALVARRHPSVVTAISVAGVSRWYDVSFAQGTRRTGFGEDASRSPEAMLLARTRVPGDADAGAVGNVTARATCADAAAHVGRARDTTPDYDAFWAERDHVAAAGRGDEPVRVPVLLAHGYRDQAVKANQSIDFFSAIPLDDAATPAVEGAPYKRLVLGQWGHESPTWDDWGGLVRRWIAEFLLVQYTGLRTEPMVQSQATTAESALPAFRTGATWPLESSATRSLYLRRSAAAGELLPEAPGAEAPATYRSTGKDTEERSRVVAGGPEVERLRYVSRPFPQDTRLAGPITLDVWFSSDSGSGQVDAVLLEQRSQPLGGVVDPGRLAPVISRGFVNIKYREGRGAAKPVVPGDVYRATITFEASDHLVKGGSALVLVLQGSNVTWVEADGAGQAISVHHDGTKDRASVLHLTTT